IDGIVVVRAIEIIPVGRRAVVATVLVVGPLDAGRVRVEVAIVALDRPDARVTLQCRRGARAAGARDEQSQANAKRRHNSLATPSRSGLDWRRLSMTAARCELTV